MERKNFLSFTNRERKKLKQKIFGDLQLETDGRSLQSSYWRIAVSIGIAASILLVAGLWMFNASNKTVSNKKLIVQTGAEARQIMLADSSVIIRNADSKVYSSGDFDGN